MSVQQAKAEHTDTIRRLHEKYLPNDAKLSFPKGSHWFVILDDVRPPLIG